LYHNCGVAQRTNGRADLAIADFDRTVQTDPRYFEAYNNRACRFLNRQDCARAIKDFDGANRLHSNYPNAYSGRARACRALGQRAKADADAAKARQAAAKQMAAGARWVGSSKPCAACSGRARCSASASS
jgi:tetratricopeptide (TPR) repeat protein